jgi:hypothetical protein
MRLGGILWSLQAISDGGGVAPADIALKLAPFSASPIALKWIWKVLIYEWINKRYPQLFNFVNVG